MPEVTRCFELSDIDLALSCAEQDNMGGIVPKVIYGYCEDVATWPTRPVATTDPLTLDAAGALVGDLVMKTGTRAYTFEFTDDTGSFTIKPQGEPGGESFLHELNITAAKTRKKILGFMNAVKGRKVFFLVEDNNGQWYLMGDKNHGARMANDSDGSTTGAAYTERNQTTLRFQYSSPRAFVYEGDTENVLTVASSGNES
ncbi:MAG: hypothetical protein IKX22_07440 [Prevotella sp.]|nr:hypothetical protein [Prevotella sp.]